MRDQTQQLNSWEAYPGFDSFIRLQYKQKLHLRWFIKYFISPLPNKGQTKNLFILSASIYYPQQVALAFISCSYLVEGQKLGFKTCLQTISVTRKKSPNVYKSWPKMISLEKWEILTPFQKLPKNVGDLGKIIVAKGFKKLPKVQKIAQSGHTADNV